MKRCPFCAEELRDEAILCRFCGATADFSKGTGAWRHNSHVRHEPIIIDIPSEPEPEYRRAPRSYRWLWRLAPSLVLLALIGVIVYAWPTWERFTRAFPEAAQRIETVQAAVTVVQDRFRALVGTDSGAAPRPSSASGSGNNAHDMLMSLSEEYRAAVLSQAVTSSGKPCPSGVETFYQGLSSDLTAMWNVRCSNGRAYLVPFAADRTGSAKVLDCGVLNAMAPVECFVELK